MAIDTPVSQTHFGTIGVIFEVLDLKIEVYVRSIIVLDIETLTTNYPTQLFDVPIAEFLKIQLALMPQSELIFTDTSNSTHTNLDLLMQNIASILVMRYGIPLIQCYRWCDWSEIPGSDSNNAIVVSLHPALIAKAEQQGLLIAHIREAGEFLAKDILDLHKKILSFIDAGYDIELSLDFDNTMVINKKINMHLVNLVTDIFGQYDDKRISVSILTSRPPDHLINPINLMLHCTIKEKLPEFLVLVEQTVLKKYSKHITLDATPISVHHLTDEKNTIYKTNKASALNKRISSDPSNKKCYVHFDDAPAEIAEFAFVPCPQIFAIQCQSKQWVLDSISQKPPLPEVSSNFAILCPKPREPQNTNLTLQILKILTPLQIE